MRKIINSLKKFNHEAFIILTLTVITLALIPWGKPHRVISPTPIPQSISEQTGRYKYNEFIDIADKEFVAPTPPANHRSVNKLLHEGFPFTKYFVHTSKIPSDWKTFENDYIKFKYPSDLLVFETNFQRIAFYKTEQEIVDAKKCLATYGSLYSDTCSPPDTFIDYAAYNDNEYSSASPSKIALYGLDNREWRADNQGYLFETATAKKIVVFGFSGNLGNREHSFRMMSTIEFKNDILINNYKVKNAQMETAVVRINTDALSVQEKDGFYFEPSEIFNRAVGIDYIPEAGSGLHQERGPDNQYGGGTEINPDIFYMNRLKGTVKTRVYKYQKAIIDVIRIEPGLAPFVADPKYCQVDNDCLARGNFCTNGAFNRYQYYLAVWGCGMGDYEGLSEEESQKSATACGTKGAYRYTNDGARCVQNKCEIINPRFFCEEN